MQCSSCKVERNKLTGIAKEIYETELESGWKSNLFFKECLTVSCINNKDNLESTYKELKINQPERSKREDS